MRTANLESIRIRLASPEDILNWSHGEVLKPETINYRTQKSEKDGLFDQRIFGPEKDYECYCGKYKRIRYKGVVCDKCGVEVTKAAVRRERMGHIKLAYPVAHIWFLKGVPSRMGIVLGLSMQQIERVIYFAAYIVTKVNEEAKKSVLTEMDKEYKSKLKKINTSKELKSKEKEKAKQELALARDKAKNQIASIKSLEILSEVEYNNLSLKYGEVFEADTGAEALRKIFIEIDMKKKIKELEKEAQEVSPIKRRKVLGRLTIFREMEKGGVRPEWMFLTALPVLPPDLRPMVQLDGGRYASSDLNDLYRRVINRNNRLKHLLEINAPEVIIRNEKRMLQEAVDALIDNGMRKGQTTKATTGGRRLLKSLADMLKGKQGRFRQNLLGKRVDYSGRSVIVVGPDLELSQCGLPKKMALELFKPFVIKKILEQELAYNVRGASRLIEAETNEVWAILEDIVKDKLVLLNRAPTLHRLGVQAFQPVLIEGEAIRIHPMVCSAYNADFDGDQMAVHVPLSEEAQREAREIMLSSVNLLKPATGLPIVTPSQDIILGCYFLTVIKEGAQGESKVFGNPQEAKLAYEFQDIDLKAKIKVRLSGPSQSTTKNNSVLTETSVGRIIFNEAFPEDFPFQNEEMNDSNLNHVISQVLVKYDKETSRKTLDKVKQLGFEYSTLSGVSWGMDDLTVPKEKEDVLQRANKEIEKIRDYYGRGLISREERRSKVIQVWQQAKSEIERLVPQTLESTGPVFSIISSGARGSWSQPVQMMGMKGLVSNAAGDTIELPIRSSFKEGFDVLEYFISTHGARKGTADTALRTSTAGYLTRRLIDVAHEIIVTEADCGDTKGVVVYLKEAQDLGQNPLFKILGSVALDKVTVATSKGQKTQTIVQKGEIIDFIKTREIIASGIEEIKIRNPLSCKTKKGVCQQCYGWDLGRNHLVELGEAVGIVAAQAIGEPGTQLTMRTFHTGGVAGGGDITRGLPRVEEIFETRVPSGRAVISKHSGEVIKVATVKDATVLTVKAKLSEDEAQESGSKGSKKKSEIVEYQLPPKTTPWVKKGDLIKKGQQLCEGNMELKELFQVAGVEKTKSYIVQEIQRIYVDEGVAIHDKHIEVIVKQMFSRFRIKEPGDSSFSPGELVEKNTLAEENSALKKAKKKPALGQQIILGISKVALTTDSFLSAASFQETSRVLIKSSLEGREDQLRGLKENVIIGRLIPAGTGFKKKK